MWRRELVIALFYPLLRANAQASKLRSCFEPVTVVASQRQHPTVDIELAEFVRADRFSVHSLEQFYAAIRPAA